MSFDTLAPYYSWMEWLLAGSKLQKCRTAFLEEARGARRILLLGEGHGRFLEELARVNPSARVTCVDSSRRMLFEAERRLKGSHPTFQVEWVHADVLSWVQEEVSFDLIATHFFLDCFTEGQVHKLVEKFSAFVKPGGKWLVADFCLPAKGLARWRAGAILWLMYRFFRATTKLPAGKLAAPEPCLAENGFRLEKRFASEWGLLHADLWILGSGTHQAGAS
jgi:ubiquinone/menaquinone biosynthesis C-methylase UbiE